MTTRIANVELNEEGVRAMIQIISNPSNLYVPCIALGKLLERVDAVCDRYEINKDDEMYSATLVLTFVTLKQLEGISFEWLDLTPEADMDKLKASMYKASKLYDKLISNLDILTKMILDNVKKRGAFPEFKEFSEQHLSLMKNIDIVLHSLFQNYNSDNDK